MSGAKARRTSKRAQLDREVIVSAAIDLAAAGEAVTFRSLGTALGADPTAVYRHFRDKEELMQVVVDRLILRSQEELDPEAPWRDQLYDGAIRTIDVFAAHPHVGVDSSTIATGGPGELSRDQLDPDPARARRAGQGSRRCASTRRTPAMCSPLRRPSRDSACAARTTRTWVGDLRAVDAARLPALSAVIPELVALSDRDVFVTGIEVFLDSVEAVAQRGPTAKPAAGAKRSRR